MLVFEFARPDTPEGPPRRVVAKRSAGDSAARTLPRVQCLLAELERTGARELGIPRPLFERDGWLVSEHAPGEPLASRRLSRRAYRRVGRALARLHRLTPVGLDPRSLEDHLAERVRPHPEELLRSLPERGALLSRALAWLRANDAWPSPVPIHRDFHLRQLFDTPERTWVVDWDDLAAGDPAFDVAGFLVYLHTHPAPDRPVQEAAFRSGYVELAPWPDADRLGLHVGFHLLRRACRRYRLRDPGWERELDRMLDGLARRVPAEGC